MNDLRITGKRLPERAPHIASVNARVLAKSTLFVENCPAVWRTRTRRVPARPIRALLPSSQTFPADLRRRLLPLKIISPCISSFSARLLFCSRDDLLLVVLDYVGRARLRCVRILTELPQRSSLAKQVPVLIELNLQFPESLAIFFAELALPVESLLFLD